MVASATARVQAFDVLACGSSRLQLASPRTSMSLTAVSIMKLRATKLAFDDRQASTSKPCTAPSRTPPSGSSFRQRRHHP